MKTTKIIPLIEKRVEFALYRSNDLTDRIRAVTYLSLWKDNVIKKTAWETPDLKFREYEWEDVPNLGTSQDPSLLFIKVMFVRENE